VLESVLEPIAGVVYRRRFSPLGRDDYSYDVELYASVKMFASIEMLRFHKNVHVRLNSIQSFKVSFGASSIVNSISGK
jgi:hypothetical protein